MKILGLVGSYRKLGNTEVLVKEALMEAQRLGAKIDMLRLTDLRIEPCKGCMACAFKQEECRISDGWSTFRDKLIENDAVILGTPTYFLGPAGVIKMITDRNIAFQYGAIQHSGNPGAIIGVSGVKGWEPFALPMLNVFMFTCGLRVIDQVMFYAQGPGEILLDESALKRARRVGFNIFEAASESAEKRTYVGEQGVCPACHQNLFSVKNGVLECALCQAKAEVKRANGGIKLVFDSETLKSHRWSEEALLKNFSLAILPSGPRFLKERDEIEKRSRKYRSFLIKK
ncbi:MAG: flavodoxin family protein [Candidatus Bathyarchaeota archaeon]|nr:flavodoxin family protein [Candidatus Bathyarchaeota archaeon]MDH5746932.1 flavodoxin family protein [Candidatus Bathyarchaeota archaeon]